MLKMLKANCRIKVSALAVLCLSIVLFNGCFLSPVNLGQHNKTADKQDTAKKDKVKQNELTTKNEIPSTEENITMEAPPSEQGSGYLSEGPAISIGIVDGDEELKVLQKIKRLEARLEEERNKVKALGEELTDLQAAKESVEKDFVNTKKELEEKSNNLLEKINTLESKIEETESRAIAAEQELNPVKKELLKTQISETKAQQELYKLKIKNLKKDEE